MNKKIVGIALAVMLGIILIESYFLLVRPNQIAPDVGNPTDSPSQTPSPSSSSETSDSPSTTDSSTLPEETLTESSGGTTNPVSDSFVPAVPEFTLKLVKHSFDIPAISSVDAFTGRNKIIQGNHWEWITVDITITNQKFSGTANSAHLAYSGLMFGIRFKGHYSQDWTNISAIYYDDAPPYTPQNSDASYTVFSLMVNPFSLAEITTFRQGVTLPREEHPDGGIDIPSGGEADFQVEALFGKTSRNPTIPFSWWTFKGVESGWSPTQTITIP